MPDIEQIDPGFTTADADYPTMSYDGGDLQLRFIDWRERPVLVTFRDVSRFEWSDEPDDYFDGETVRWHLCGSAIWMDTARCGSRLPTLTIKLQRLRWTFGCCLRLLRPG